MATFKRQREDGTWEYVQMVGMDVLELQRKIDEKYSKPIDGISKDDLSNDVKAKLNDIDSKSNIGHTHKMSEINTSSMKIPKLLTYYGYPVGVNKVWDEDYASSYFSQYDYIIFGDKVQRPTHSEYDSSIRIISKVKQLNKNIIIFGYIPLGVSTENRSIDTLKADIDSWIVAGAEGIFVDEFGYDYLVTRERQNEIVDYIHSKGLPAFVNSWEPSYVFEKDNIYLDWEDFNGNPNNIPTSIGDKDYAMIEGFMVKDNSSSNEKCGGFVSKWSFEKYDDWVRYRREFGTKIIGQNIIDETKPNYDNKVDMTFGCAYLYSLDAIGIARSDFGSSKSDLLTYEEPTLTMFGDYYDTEQAIQHITLAKAYEKHTRISEKGEITVITNEATGEYYAIYPKSDDSVLKKVDALLESHKLDYSSHSFATESVALNKYSNITGVGAFAGMGILYEVINSVENEDKVTVRVPIGYSQPQVGQKVYIRSDGFGIGTGTIVSATDVLNGESTIEYSTELDVYSEDILDIILTYDASTFTTNNSNGYYTVASNDTAYAEGYKTKATGLTSHAEGFRSVASGASSHAEGGDNESYGKNSHVEGYLNKAVSNISHVEGRYSLGANGTLYEIKSTINGDKVLNLNNVNGLSVGDLLHIKVNNDNSILEIPIIAINGNAVTLGTTETISSRWKYAVKLSNVDYPVHAEGENTIASGLASHAEGFNSIASAPVSHAEGGSFATGEYAHAEGLSSTASGKYSHAEGLTTSATNDGSHSEGVNTIANASYSHAEGSGSKASGTASHAEGTRTVAFADSSHAEGEGTSADVIASHASGRYNKKMTGSQYGFVNTDDAFVIGNGTSNSALSNSFRITFNGKAYGLASFNSTGADYAEFFEWQDGNVNGEDRIGYFVALDGDKIKIANSNDYIVGVISANPSVIGDSHQDDWWNKYVRDEWGRIQYEHVDTVYKEFDENGNEIEKVRKDYLPKINPDWDSSQEFAPRESRKEWGIVGMMGKLLVRDDGTCQVNGYCKPNDNGEATASNNGYRVMERVSDNIIKILIK